MPGRYSCDWCIGIRWILTSVRLCHYEYNVEYMHLFPKSQFDKGLCHFTSYESLHWCFYTGLQHSTTRSLPYSMSSWEQGENGMKKKFHEEMTHKIMSHAKQTQSVREIIVIYCLTDMNAENQMHTVKLRPGLQSLSNTSSLLLSMATVPYSMWVCPVGCRPASPDAVWVPHHQQLCRHCSTRLRTMGPTLRSCSSTVCTGGSCPSPPAPPQAAPHGLWLQPGAAPAGVSMGCASSEPQPLLHCG